jgi:hypothetical protein
MKRISSKEREINQELALEENQPQQDLLLFFYLDLIKEEELSY